MGNNIQLPYSSFINGGVRDGMELVLSGTPKPNCDRFSINFCSAATASDGDVAFHFNPRLNQGPGCVVRNHKQSKMWGAEETAGAIPFRKGQYFTMQLQVRNQGYKVLVNGKHFCDFTHRMSLATVKYLHISGDVIVHDMHLKGQEQPSAIAVPYNSFIVGGVSEGLEVMINGSPKPNCVRFAVNLSVAPNAESGDIIFHFNPRLKQGCVVRNHRQGSAWGAEETAGGMPFAVGHLFNLKLVVNMHGFTVFVNNNHFCDFTHRLATEMVQYLSIKGDVSINSVQFNKKETPKVYPKAFSPPTYPGAAAPPPYPGVATPVLPQYPGANSGPLYNPYPGANSGPLYNPMVPVMTPIQGGFYPGKIIHITGTPRALGSRFHVDLVCGFSQSSDLALNFDVRFNYGSDRHIVVRNHRMGGQFGMEERHMPYFPFVQNANFEMMILCEPHCVKVAVNNQHFIEFNHRVQPPSLVNHLQIVGDVTIHQIRFQ